MCLCISYVCKQCSNILVCDKQTPDLSSLRQMFELWMWIWLRFVWGFGYLTPRTCCTLIRTLTLWAHTHTHTARRSGLFIGTYVRVERTFSCPYSCLRLTGNIRLFLARSLPPTFSHSQLPHLNFSLLPCPPLSLSVCLHHIFISLCRTALLRALAYRDPFHAAEVHSGCRL